MSFKSPEISGARQDIGGLKSPEIDGARQDCACLKVCVDGAWEEVWGSMIEFTSANIGSVRYSYPASIIGEGKTITLTGQPNEDSYYTSLDFSISLYAEGSFGATPTIELDMEITTGSQTAYTNVYCKRRVEGISGFRGSKLLCEASNVGSNKTYSEHFEFTFDEYTNSSGVVCDSNRIAFMLSFENEYGFYSTPTTVKFSNIKINGQSYGYTGTVTAG